MMQRVQINRRRKQKPALEMLQLVHNLESLRRVSSLGNGQFQGLVLSQNVVESSCEEITNRDL